MGAGMAIIVDGILGQGYFPDGFEQRDGYRLYAYVPMDWPNRRPIVLIFVYFAVLFLSGPAVLTFLVLFAISRRRACLIAGLLWLIPIPYELWIQSNCTGECNIRIDLLLVLPVEVIVLLTTSGVGFRSFAGFRRARKAANS